MAFFSLFVGMVEGGVNLTIWGEGGGVKTTNVLYLIIVSRVQKEKVPWPIVVQNTGLGVISLKFPLTPLPQRFGSVAYFGNKNLSFLEKTNINRQFQKNGIYELRTARNKFSIKFFWLF